MIFEKYLIKQGQVSLLLQHFDPEEKLVKEEISIVYFLGQQLSKKQFKFAKPLFLKNTERNNANDLILNINNDVDGKFIFQYNEEEKSCQKKNFVGVEFYQIKKKLILKIFNKEAFETQLPENFQDFLVRALIKTNIDENYIIKELLGRGGFSYVYSGIQKSNGQKVAIKKIEKLHLMQIKHGPELIYSEILILKKLEHPNIVQIIDVYQSVHHFYLVMEFIEGPTLQQVFKSKVNSQFQIQQFCKQFLILLKYLECNEILHQDIKPGNIIFRSQDVEMQKFCLIDFGFARSIKSQHKFSQNYGTVGFIAPELMNSKDIKNESLLKADIYSFGQFSQNVFRGTYKEVEQKNLKNDIPLYILDNKQNNTLESLTLLQKKIVIQIVLSVLY